MSTEQMQCFCQIVSILVTWNMVNLLSCTFLNIRNLTNTLSKFFKNCTIVCKYCNWIDIKASKLHHFYDSNVIKDNTWDWHDKTLVFWFIGNMCHISWKYIWIKIFKLIIIVFTLNQMNFSKANQYHNFAGYLKFIITRDGG